LTKLPDRIMHLNLFDNDLTSLPSNFFQQHQYPALRSIDFRNNSLTTIEAGTFTNLPALTTLYLSYNDIKTIEPGAFGDALPALTTIRLDHNSIERLEKNTFHSLPMLAIVRLRANPLHTVVPGTFQSLPSLRRIEMNGTLTNASMLGSYDQGTGVSTITFAPDCLALQYLELGRLRLTSLYPNYFHSDEFFGIINRIGAREIYSTDIAECDRLNGGAVFSELFGAIVCSMGVSVCTFCSFILFPCCSLCLYGLVQQNTDLLTWIFIFLMSSEWQSSFGFAIAKRKKSFGARIKRF
jgi:hypothetical protein